MGFQFDTHYVDGTQIAVVGIGGAGGNAVNRMVSAGIQDVEFVAMNTDQQALTSSDATHKLQLGEKLTRGQGAGGNPERGQRAAEESREEISALLKGKDMVFITAGMGGGTGTGAAPIVAEVARDMGILTVGVVTKPFGFEGRKRMEQAEGGIAALREHVDSLVVIPNDKLKEVSETRLTLANAFQISDDVLRQGVQSIAELITTHGFVNLDFADVKEVMKDAGYAHMGVGFAEGKDKAVMAAQAAISSPLLETSIDGATGLILNFTAPSDFDLAEMDEAATQVTRYAHPDARVYWGVAFDDSLQDAVRVTVIATGFSSENKASAPVNKKPEEKDDKDIFFGNPFISSLQKNQEEAELQETPAASTPVEKEDDGDFIDIMSIFKKRQD